MNPENEDGPLASSRNGMLCSKKTFTARLHCFSNILSLKTPYAIGISNSEILVAMRLATLTVLLALCLQCHAFYSSGSAVKSLDPSTFDKAIKGGIHLVEFYAPWW